MPVSFFKHDHRRIILLIITCILSLVSLVFPISIRPTTYLLKLGDVASQEIIAPRSLSFPSEVLTRQAKAEAENSVQPVYLPADRSVVLHQITRLKANLNYINSVRSDSLATLEQKLIDLSAMTDIRLNVDNARQILTVEDAQWQTIQQESLNVLELVMRSTIREDRVKDAQRNIPSLISFSIGQEQAQIITELVSAFVIPNSLYSEQLTQEARQEAISKVTPVIRNFIDGETIVLRGQIVTDLVVEALQQFGLLKSTIDLKNIIAASILVVLGGTFLGMYHSKRNNRMLNDFNNLVIISVSFLIFLFAARITIPNRTVIPYLFPLPAFGLTVAFLFNTEIGLIFSIIISTLAAYSLPNTLDLTLFYSLSSLCGILILGKGRRIASFFWAGITIGLVGGAVVLAYRLSGALIDWIGIATLVGAAFFNGIASASIVLLLQFFLAQLLDLATPFRLLDLSRTDHPLLQLILRNAPGTYQHSLQVANLAEQAAETIGADTLLVRVGALYHDAGKAANPSFFIENQLAGTINPHDGLDPYTSASFILNHITDGILLAQKYHIPRRIQDFILEHHGTLLTRYQYSRAVKAANDDPSRVDQEHFRYPGPSPRSKETALLMLADGCEAKTRAEMPKNDEEIQIIVNKVFNYVQQEGQLDQTNLTFSDLEIIRLSFITTLQNTYHPRIRYPELPINPQNIYTDDDVSSPSAYIENITN